MLPLLVYPSGISFLFWLAGIVVLHTLYEVIQVACHPKQALHGLYVLRHSAFFDCSYFVR